MILDLTSDLYSWAALDLQIDGQRIALIVLGAFAGGLARGFSGFGVGLVFMPLGAAVLGPKLAVASLLIFDLIVSAPTTLRGVRIKGLKPLLPIWTGLSAATPVGALAATQLDPGEVRWFVSAFIACVLVFLTSGWRPRVENRPGSSFVAGIAGGFMGGLAALNGIVVVTYWMATGMEPQNLRANLLTLFCATSIVSVIAFIWAGMLTAQALCIAAILVVPYATGSLLGAALFPFASPQTFRRIVYGMIAGSMVIGSPFLDPVLR